MCTETFESTKLALVRPMGTKDLYLVKVKIEEGEIKDIKARKLKQKLLQ